MLGNLVAQLKATGSHEQIVAALQHGTHHWMAYSDPSQVRALMAGSLHARDTLLTTAFLEQNHSIGWYQLFLGKVSRTESYALYRSH